jgi:hypothetical protein
MHSSIFNSEDIALSPHRTRRKAAFNRRARVAVVCGVLFFVAGQAAFRLALAWHPVIGDREFGSKLDNLRARIAESPGRPLVVMLGSSRVATGFRPDALPRIVGPDGREAIAFNFAQVGTGPQIAHLVLQRLLAQGVRPDWVFVEFWPPFWASDGYLGGLIDSLNLATLDWPAARLVASYLPRPKQFYGRWLPAQLTPIFASRFSLLSHLGASWAPNFDPDRRLRNLDESGWWAPRSEIDDADRRRLVAHYRGIYGERLAQLKIRPTPDRALHDLLALCRRNSIKAAIVVLPEGDDFRALYPPDARLAVDAYLARISRDATIIDARDWVPDAGFSDGHHLLPAGATAFTERFGRDALSPLLLGKPPQRLARPDRTSTTR